MRRRADVGLGDVCVSYSRSRYHRAHTLAIEYVYAKASANREPDSSRTGTEWDGGALNVAASFVRRWRRHSALPVMPRTGHVSPGELPR